MPKILAPSEPEYWPVDLGFGTVNELSLVPSAKFVRCATSRSRAVLGSQHYRYVSCVRHWRRSASRVHSNILVNRSAYPVMQIMP